MDPLPTFIVIGAQKAGTASLHAYLRKHPDVFMSSPKELHFFVDGPRWRAGPDAYRAFFREGAGHVARGESTPTYSMYPTRPHVPERMASLIPDVKIVYLVRDPIERMFSQYQMGLRSGYETRPVAKALKFDSLYLYPSMYGLQLAEYLEHFDREQILVVRSEDLARDRVATLDRILAHIGVTGSIPKDQVAFENNVQGSRRGLRLIYRNSRAITRGRSFPYRAGHLAYSYGRYALGRRLRQNQLEMTEGLADDLRGVLHQDLLRFKSLVADDFDLWGVA